MSLLLSLLALQAGAVAETEARPARATQSLASWLSDSDYPEDALARGEEGTVGFRLVVDPQGRVIDCKIERSAGSASLDTQTCALMTARARFHPARNAAGQPVIDTVRSRIRWVMGGSLPADMLPFAPLRLVVVISVSDDRQARCRIEVNGTAAPDGTPCPDISSDALEFAQRIAPTGQLVMVRSFIPEGETIAAPEAPHDRLLGEISAELTIGAQGDRTECRTLAPQAPTPGNAALPDMCAAPWRQRFPAGAANRRARLTTSLYLRARTTP